MNLQRTHVFAGSFTNTVERASRLSWMNHAVICSVSVWPMNSSLHPISAFRLLLVYFSEYSKPIVKGSVIILLLLADAMPRILCRQHLTQHGILFLVDSNSNSYLTDIVVVSWISPEQRHSYLDDISNRDKYCRSDVIVINASPSEVPVIRRHSKRQQQSLSRLDFEYYSAAHPFSTISRLGPGGRVFARC